MKKISLETRISRIKSGMCSSPDHILEGLKAFGQMNVQRMVALMFSDLEKSYQNHMYLHYLREPECITYGDLSVLIARDYLENGVHSEKHIDSLIQLYCTAFEFQTCYQAAVNVQKITLTRDQYLERLGLQDIKGLVDLKMDEYFEEIKKTDLPEESQKWLYGFSIEKAGLMSMRLQKIYETLIDHAKIKDVRYHDPIGAGYPASSLTIRKQLVELLVMPLAALVSEEESGDERKEMIEYDE